MNPELFDTHCHLNSGELLERRQQVLANAAAAGVSRLITVACRPDEFEVALSLRAEYAGLYIAAGIHPHEAARVDETAWPRLAQVWQAVRVVAAGEMGLDYHYDFSPRDVQKQVFERQLRLAAPTGLPLVIHSREAQQDVISLLCDHGYEHRKVVFHCFSGTPEEAAELRGHGWWTSFTGLITFRNSSSQLQACLETPLDQLMFETDSPYLSPEPVRKMRPNEPANVRHTIQFAARSRGADFAELAARTTANARRFFGIDEPLVGS